MLSTKLAVSLFGLVVLATACTATPAATNSPGTGASAPTTGATAGPTPTPAGTLGMTPPPASGNPCAAFPSMDPNNPSFAPDPQLESHFPSTIDGQPLTDVSSGSFAQFVCLNGPAELQQLQGQASYNVSLLTWGSATATVDNEEIELLAFRLPGGDANQLVNSLAALAAASGGSADVKSIGTGTAGGKNVFVVQNTDGSTSYGLVSGDTLITADSITQSQADKIFSAVK